MSPSPSVPNRTDVPHWDAERHELYYLGQLVKGFDQLAENQEEILAAFQENGWQSRIDNPFPRDGIVDPKERLHDAVKNLNRYQTTPLLRFRGDGSGKGVVWEPTAGGGRFPSASLAFARNVGKMLSSRRTRHPREMSDVAHRATTARYSAAYLADRCDRLGRRIADGR